MGICVDDEGSLYICECDRADVIRKISGIDGYVSTIAGTLDKESPQANGERRLNQSSLTRKIFLMMEKVTSTLPNGGKPQSENIQLSNL